MTSQRVGLDFSATCALPEPLVCTVHSPGRHGIEDRSSKFQDSSMVARTTTSYWASISGRGFLACAAGVAATRRAVAPATALQRREREGMGSIMGAAGRGGI